MRSESKPLNPCAGDSIKPYDATNGDQEILSASVIATALVLFSVQGIQSEQFRNTWLMQWLNETFEDLTTPLLILPPLFLLGIVIAWGLPRIRVGARLRFPCSLLALGFLLVASVSKIPFPNQPGAWTGFGYGPTLASLILALLLLSFRRPTVPKVSKKLATILKVVIPAAVMIPYSLVYIQPPNGLINLGDTTYHVLDELLAPMLGAYPLSEYSPQYSGMLGWVLYPLKFFSLSGEATMLAVVIASNIFNLLIPILVLLIVIGIFPTLPKMTTLAAFVVIWGISGLSRGESVQLREFAHFGRFVPILFVIWIIVRMLNSHGSSQQKLALIAGLASAFLVLGSPDHGLSFVAAFLLSLSLATYRKWVGIVIHFWYLFGMLFGIASYCLVLMLLGKAPSLASWIGLRIEARSIYGGGVAEVFSPLIIVMAIALTSIVFGLTRISGNSINNRDITFRIIILTIGLWLQALLVKFLLAPHPVGLPPLFIPSFIAFCLIIGRLRIDSRAYGRLSNRLLMLPVLCVLALPVASLWHFPEPRDELRRISGRYVNTTNWSSTPGRVSDGWSPNALKKYDDFIINISVLAEKIQSEDDSIGYFGIFGHTIELLTGIDNVLGIPAPESLRFGPSQEKLACVPVVSRKPHFIIVYSPSFPCSNYSLNLKYSLDKFLVYERVDSPTISP